MFVPKKFHRKQELKEIEGKKKVENKKINLRLCLVPENARKRKLGRKKQLKK